MGMKISIDDFGIGYSSLRHLKRLPVHQMKIDREFVVAASDRPEHQAIIKAILSIADAFRLQVVAEGIESELDADWLIGAGCRRHQGFHYGKPVPAPLFRDLYLLPFSEVTQ